MVFGTTSLPSVMAAPKLYGHIDDENTAVFTVGHIEDGRVALALPWRAEHQGQWQQFLVDVGARGTVPMHITSVLEVSMTAQQNI